MGSYWALFTAIADGVIDFDAGSESKLYPPVLVSWVIALATLVSLLALGLFGFSMRPVPADYLYGIPIGLLLAFANIAYFRALASGPMGLISAVGGIAVLVPVLYDSLIGRGPSLTGGFGVFIILSGVYLIAMQANDPAISKVFNTKVLMLAAAAAATFGITDILFKLGHSTSGISLLLVIQLVEWLSFSLILAARKIAARVHRHDLLLLIPLGLVNTLGWVAYAVAARNGRIDIASALSYCSPVFTLLLAHFCIGEVLSRKEILAFFMIICGAWLLA